MENIILKEKQLESALDSLRAIADMQVQETTDFRELAALCISIAKIELAKTWEE